MGKSCRGVEGIFESELYVCRRLRAGGCQKSDIEKRRDKEEKQWILPERRRFQLVPKKAERNLRKKVLDNKDPSVL